MLQGLKLYAIFAFLCVIFLACKESIDQFGDDAVVAEVGHRMLYKSELDNMIHPTISVFDSTALANAYIDQWVRDRLLMVEASKHFSSDFEIEELVDNYRSNLIKIRMEEKIIEERYDTTVTDNELQAFYMENQEQFLLPKAIYRCRYAKIRETAPSLRDLIQSWNAEDTVEVRRIMVEDGQDYMLDGTRWHSWEEIEKWTDAFSENMTNRSSNLRNRQEESEFFLKILESKDEREISPLSYVDYQLKLMILHQRKQRIIEEYKQELYEKALESNLIRI